jgi:two-component system chemotaxis sensor kinase CheA
MKEKLERLGEAFVLAEIEDRPGLEELRRRLEELLQEALPARMAETGVALRGVIDRLIAGEDTAPAFSWKVVERSISALHAMAADAEAAGSVPPPQEFVPAAGGAGGQAPSENASVTSSEPPAVPLQLDADILSGFIVEAREHLDAADLQLLALESDASNVGALHTVFRAFHTIKGAASCLDLSAMQALAHETENLLELARRGGLPMTGRAMDVVFEAVDAMKRLTSDAEAELKSGSVRGTDPALNQLIARIREIVSSRTEERVGQAPPPPVPLSRGEGEEPLHFDGDPPSSVQPSSASSETRVSVKEPVRVDAERLDRLVDLIGELVIAESMVSQSNELRAASGGALSKSVAQLDKITREVQEMGMSLRMVPVRPLFHKMARLARDLSRKLGKPVEFVTSGEEIEIDKAIVNCVADALVHIIRNALDHGIETDPADRLKEGKPEAGRLELRADHREGCIVIEVEDDGRGLDPEAIRSKGIEKGIVRKGEGLSEQDIFRLIFLPGFSTAKVVTELSGRGVGLDVVRTSVEALRGRIEVQSERGRGTLFRLRLPLTLAIIDGMVIRAGRERYVVPTLSITRLVRPESGQLAALMDRDEMLSLQDDLIPFFRLNRLLDVSDAVGDARSGVAVVVEEGGRRVALLADEVLGQQQIVIKSLGVDLEGVPGISGGVILPDGQVGLILDVGGLLSRSSASSVVPVSLPGGV